MQWKNKVIITQIFKERGIRKDDLIGKCYATLNAVRNVTYLTMLLEETHLFGYLWL